VIKDLMGIEMILFPSSILSKLRDAMQKSSNFKIIEPQKFLVIFTKDFLVISEE
jgi:hypothetical protein